MWKPVRDLSDRILAKSMRSVLYDAILSYKNLHIVPYDSTIYNLMWNHMWLGGLRQVRAYLNESIMDINF